MLSVIIPAYNEEDMIGTAYSAISDLLNINGISYEIIFINDGSKDSTWECIEAISKNAKHIKGVNFSRNFGKEAAMFAGITYAKGDCCVLIDCDLQHPPEKIIDMYRLWEQGYEVIEGVKLDRGKENPTYSFASKCFYSIMSKAVKIDLSRASDFKLLDRKAMNVILNIREKHAFLRALSSWIGFKTTMVEFEVRERSAGETKWSSWSLIKYAFSNITSFSSAPMQIVTILGVLMLGVSVVFAGIAMYQKLAGIAVEGFTTVIIIQLFTGSITMISLGIIGYYIAKIYEEVKGRPKYVVSNVCGEGTTNLGDVDDR